MSGYDEEEHIMETFANFGRAYYMSNVFEEGLVMAALFHGFLEEQKAKVRVRKNLDRAEYEADFDAYVARHYAQTMGNLIKIVSKFDKLGDDFISSLPAVKAKRDFLAHRYFRDRAVDFVTRSGRDAMIAELDEMAQLFGQVDNQLSLIMDAQHEAIGMGKADVERIMQRMLAEAEAKQSGR